MALNLTGPCKEAKRRARCSLFSEFKYKTIISIHCSVADIY